MKVIEVMLQQLTLFTSQGHVQGKRFEKTQVYSSQDVKREIHIVFVRLNGVKTVKMKLEVAIMRTYCETEI